MPRKKTEEIAIVPDTPVLPVDDAVEESLPELMSEPVTEDITPQIVESLVEEPEAAPEAAPEAPPKRTVRRRTTTRKKQPAEEPETPPAEDTTEEPESDTVQPWEILTVDARGEAETQEQREDIIWHEIHTGYRTRRILTGMLSGIEKTDAGRTIAIVDYKGFRIVIPLREMVLDFPKGLYGIDYDEMILNYQKILNKMLGAEVDFVIKGIDGNSRSVVASRKDAMLKSSRSIISARTATVSTASVPGAWCRPVWLPCQRGSSGSKYLAWRRLFCPVTFRGTGSAMPMTAFPWEIMCWCVYWKLTVLIRSRSGSMPMSKV